MWTGDFESTYPTQWALNPSAYQNIPSEQVDWATLAQQWIKMKETFPVNQVPPAPPPPSIKADIEAGEAPMDMSKDETPPNTSSSTSQDGSNWNSWNNWQNQQWNWGWNGSDKPVPSGPSYNYSQPAAPAPPSFSGDVPPTTFDYNHGATGPLPNNFDQPAYWSGNQAPFVRNKISSEWRSESRGSSSRRHVAKEEEVEPDSMTMIDAAKRKQLPAWIREGLEKMEREKQKKLDRERQLKEREEEIMRRKQEEEEALASGIPLKSKFDTDSGESDKELEEVPPVKPKKSRFDTTEPSPDVANRTLAKPVSPPPPVKRKTKDEIMQDVMQQMRYVLTDILMTVTNEEMQRISEEVLSELRAKAPATQLRKTPAFTSLTGKLGLGIYDSDSEESSEESDHEQSSKKENGVDSDEELRERISRKKQEFAKIERDIEHKVEQQEEREREREREQTVEEDEEDIPEDKGQVEPKPTHPGFRSDVKVEDQIVYTDPNIVQNNTESFTPERPHNPVKESSEEQSEESDDESSSEEEDSSSSSSSGSRRRKSKKERRRKEKKRRHKRSPSHGSDRRKSSHKKSSHRHERDRDRYRYERSRSRSHSRSRSRSRDHYRRHSSESYHKRRHHGYSHSPDYSRGKKSSHRSRD